MITIQIQNDGTGTDESANYDWRVGINFHLIARGRVEGFNRADGWRELLRLVSYAPNIEPPADFEERWRAFLGPEFCEKHPEEV